MVLTKFHICVCIKVKIVLIKQYGPLVLFEKFFKTGVQEIRSGNGILCSAPSFGLIFHIKPPELYISYHCPTKSPNFIHQKKVINVWVSYNQQHQQFGNAHVFIYIKFKVKDELWKQGPKHLAKIYIHLRKHNECIGD